MRTNTKNTAVVALNEFLLISNQSEVKNHYQLTVLNQLTGKSASLQISGELPASEVDLRNDFEAQIAIILNLGFKNFEDFRASLASEGMSLEFTEKLEEYREISLKSSTLLYIFGDVQRLEDILDLQLN